MITISKLSVNSYSTGFLDLSWEIADTEEDTADYNFYVYRSGSEHGPWTLLTPGGLNEQFIYRDLRVNILSKRVDYFYYIKIENTFTKETSSTSPVRHAYEPNLVAIEIARREALGLKVNTGERCFIFKKKNFGARCSCYDNKLGRKIKGNCLSCFGVGIVGGYFRPIVTFVEIVESGDRKVSTEIGITEPNMAQAKLSNFPIVGPGDIIVSSINKRYRIGSPLTYRKINGIIVVQLLTLIELAPSEIEYKIPIYKNDYDRYEGQAFRYERLTDYYATLEINGEEKPSSKIIRDRYGEKALRDKGAAPEYETDDNS